MDRKLMELEEMKATFVRCGKLDEWNKMKADHIALQESTHADLQARRKAAMPNIPMGKKQIQVYHKIARDVLVEAVNNVFVESLVLDNPERFSESLKGEVRKALIPLFENCNMLNSYSKLFKDGNFYMQESAKMAEDVATLKANQMQDDQNVEDISLSVEDKKMMSDIENINGRKDYGEEVLKRVTDVFAKEKEMGEERKDKMEKIIAFKTDKEDKTPEEAMQECIQSMDSRPSTIFNALVNNRSKIVINESGSVNLSEKKETIMTEAICMYTLLECINYLEIVDYDKKKLKSEIIRG